MLNPFAVGEGKTICHQLHLKLGMQNIQTIPGTGDRAVFQTGHSVTLATQ